MIRYFRKFSKTLKENLRKTAFASRLAVGVLTLFLILFNLTLWFLSNRLVRLQETANKQTLETSIQLISRAINPRDLFFLQVSYDPLLEATDFERLAIYADSPSVLSLVQSFKATGVPASSDSSRERVSTYLAGDYEIALITPDGYLALDGTQLYTEPVLPNYYDDGKMLELARTGELSLSGWTTLNIAPQAVRVRHAYFPLYAPAETLAPIAPKPTPVAILQLEYREPLLRFTTLLPRRLTQLAILSTLLVIVLWFVLNRLISRSLKFRQAAEQGDRLRALGNLTAGVAHEIRNPLGIILLTLEEIRSVCKAIKEAPVREEIEALSRDLQEETKRLEDLTEQFLSFTRGHVSKKKRSIPQATPLGELTKATVKLFSKSLEADVKVHLNCSLEESDQATISPHEWRQILLNLLQNSVQAMPKGRGGDIHVQQSATKSTLLTTIKDNGKGMDKQTLARVFDPFFTTREEGTGLGLSLSRKLVEDAGGTLKIESEVAKGSIITLELPRV